MIQFVHAERKCDVSVKSVQTELNSHLVFNNT